MNKKHDKKEKSKKIKKKSNSKHKILPETYGDVVLGGALLKAFSDHLEKLINGAADRVKFDQFVLKAVENVFTPISEEVSHTKFLIDISPNADPNKPMALEVRITSVQMA